MNDFLTYAKEWKSGMQLLRYVSVGIATNLTGYLIFVLIIHFGFEPKRVMTFMYAAVATCGFFAHREWTFSHRGAMLSAGSRYCIAHIGGYLINLALLYVFVDRLGYLSQWVQAIAAFVVAGYLFVTFRYFVFPKGTPTAKGRIVPPPCL